MRLTGSKAAFLTPLPCSQQPPHCTPPPLRTVHSPAPAPPRTEPKVDCPLQQRSRPMTSANNVLCPSLPLPLAHTEPKAECAPEQRLSVLRAVRQGLVCSFGSVCIAGAILMLLQAVNQVLSWVQQASQVRLCGLTH